MQDLWFEVIGDCLVFVQSKNNIPDSRADEVVAFWRNGHQHVKKFLIFTDGGHPTSAQRKRQQTIIDFTKARLAVVSDSPLTRFVISSLALVAGQAVLGVSPDELGRAIAHLQLAPPQEAELRRWIRTRAKREEFAHFKVFRAAA